MDGSDLLAAELCSILPGSGLCALIDGAVTVVKSSLESFPEEYCQQRHGVRGTGPDLMPRTYIGKTILGYLLFWSVQYRYKRTGAEQRHASYRGQPMTSVADRIAHFIAQAGLGPGSRLPAERRLAADFGISRARLREAIQQLAARGVLKSRQGGGTFVVGSDTAGSVERAFHPVSLLARSERGFWQDVMEVRKSLDAEAAYLAALRASDEDKDKLGQAFERVRSLESRDPRLQARADAAFHLAIAEASRNLILHQVMSGLDEVLEASISDSLMRLYRLPGAAASLDRQHRDILEAIVAGRADEARRAARDHLDFVEQSLRRLEEDAARERRARQALATVIPSKGDSAP